jgi:3-hydroxyacyl-[acyl-carrier-protein] dehydratase
METIFNVLQIQDILPHRYPFLYVDKIVELEPRQRIVGIKNVTINEPFFQGHFPGRPLMPGVLIIEALAQISAILAKKSEVEGSKEGDFLLVGADNFKFKRTVEAGDVLKLESVFTKQKGPLWIITGKATVDDQLVAQGVISAIISKQQK